MSSKDVKIKLPKSLGGIVDLLYKTRMERKKIEGEAGKKKDIEVFISNYLLKEYGKENLKGAKGRKASASIKKRDIATVENFDFLIKHIKKTNDYDLLQRRVNEKAVKERWAAGKRVPGVGKFTSIKVVPHKLGAKETEGDDD